MTDDLFASEDPKYEAKGLITVPVGANKEALGKGWNASNPSPEERAARRHKYPKANIGLKAGTLVPGGRRLAAVDVDYDPLTGFIGELIGPAVSGKIGQKGITLFVQADSELTSCKILAPGTAKPVVELMITSGMVVIPPSMHPAGTPYRWVGKPLLEVDLTDLPVLTTEKISIVRTILSNPHTWDLIDGGAEIKAHNLMLSLTSSGIARLTEDLSWLARCLGALLHPGYRGDVRDEILEMLESAKRKDLGARTYQPGNAGPIPVGYTIDSNYVLLDSVRQIIVSFSSTQLLSTQHLLGLAPSSFWAEQFPAKQGVFNAMRAGEALIAACRYGGPFRASKVRGRGVWREGEQVVVNLGGEIASRDYIYLCFDPIELQADAEFDTQRLLRLLQAFAWRHPQDAMLLLGWLMVAPICGVLKWRPHSFVYGPARSGKTTIHSIASQLLRPLVVSADGQSTEAGIRQSLGPDSLPVVIDEFESDQSAGRLKGIIRLARSASSADAPVLRGTPEGKAMTFSLRSMFFFSSINPRGFSQADASRIVMLELLMHGNDPETARFIAAESAYFRSLGPNWCAYAVQMAPLIQLAIDAVAPHITGDLRHRENMSVLLSSAFIALNGRVPSPDEAMALVAEFTPAIERHLIETERDDAQECLGHLMAHVVDDYPLWHWLVLERDRLTSRVNAAVDAPRIVASMGIRVVVDGEIAGILIRNGAPAIDRVFEGTAWANGAWRSSLRKLAGAFTPTNPVQFQDKNKVRCTGLPLAYLADEPLPHPGDEKRF